MIPRDYITQWRERVPWSEDFQVEQDLVISRVLVEIFSDPFSPMRSLSGVARRSTSSTDATRALLRGHRSGAGKVWTGWPVMDGLRQVLNPRLGQVRSKQSEGQVTFGYRFQSEDVPAVRLRLKVEINTC